MTFESKEGNHCFSLTTALCITSTSASAQWRSCFCHPNTMSGLQPMDVGIAASVKAFYRHCVVEQLLFNVDRSKVQSSDVPDLKIMLLVPSSLSMAWHQVQRSAIRNCFLKGGSVPPATSSDETGSESASAESRMTSLMRKFVICGNMLWTQNQCPTRWRWKTTSMSTRTGSQATDDTILLEACAAGSNAEESVPEDEEAPPSVPCVIALRSVDAFKDFVTDYGIPMHYLAHL